jgi:PAS domain-containing protein
MRSIWKPIGLLAGLIAVGAGTMMLMGNIHSADHCSADLEFTKLRAMAAVWQTRLDGARFMMREQCLTQGLLDITQAPGEWATWRAAQKYQDVIKDWNPNYGKPRGFGLLIGAHQIHSVFGDTSGFAAATLALQDQGDVDILPGIYSNDGCVAVQYTVAAPSPERPVCRFLALIQRTQLLPITDSPANWHLLATPEDARFSSAPGTVVARVSAVTWPLLLQQNSGMIPGNSGDQWGFAKIELPGNEPLLLVGALMKPAATRRTASLLVFAGAIALFLTALASRTRPAAGARETIATTPTPESGAPVEAHNYREIFQTIRDPLCLVESDGRIVRANHSAQELLSIKKSLPDAAIYFEHGELQVLAAEFLRQIAAHPHENSGPCRLVNGETILFSGTVTAGRLYADQYHHGPVLIQFHAETEEEQPISPTVLQSIEFSSDRVDACNPYPVIRVSSEGIIEQFNDAARAVCPTLDTSPLLADALPALAESEWTNLVKFSDTKTLETVFGGGTYEFHVVRMDSGVLLYGYPAAESNNLTIALEQAQAGFNALCNLTPAAVMLVTVHEHTVLQCNMEACDLFSMPAPALVGNRLENLSAFPWELQNDPEQEFYALTPDGRTIRCALACELIKLDGEPTMLVVMNPVATSFPLTEQPVAPEFQPATNGHASPPALDPQRGPGILIISNPVVRDVARKLLARFGHDCEAFTSLDDATIWLISHDTAPNFITLDVTDFDETAEWLGDMRARFGHVPVIAITDGENSEGTSAEDAYMLTKPFDLDTVEHALRELHVEPVMDEHA